MLEQEHNEENGAQNETPFQDEKTVQLRKPVTLGTGASAVEYTELTLCEPSAYQLEKAYHANAFTFLLNLISMNAKVPRRVIEKLCQRDMGECSDFLSTFNAAVPKIGDSSLPS